MALWPLSVCTVNYCAISQRLTCQKIDLRQVARGDPRRYIQRHMRNAKALAWCVCQAHMCFHWRVMHVQERNKEETLFPIAICAMHKGSSHTDLHCLCPSLVAFQQFLLLYVSIETVPLPRPSLHIESASRFSIINLYGTYSCSAYYYYTLL